MKYWKNIWSGILIVLFTGFVIGLFIGIDLVFTGWAFILSGLLLKKA